MAAVNKNASSVLSYLDTQLDKTLTMLLSLVAATSLSTLVQLNDPNDFSISNVANIQYGWGAETNYLRLIFIAVFTLLIFFGVQKLRERFAVKWFRLGVAAFAAIIFFITVSAALPASNSVDMFHTGERLSPTLDYTKDKHLFSDLFFMHGAGEGILLPSLSFDIWQTSIGSFALFSSLLRGVSVFLFFTLLALLIRANGFYLFTVVWFLGTGYMGFDYTKNILVYIMLGLLWLAVQRVLTLRARLIALFFIGFLSSISLLNSIDMGVIMTLLSCLLGVILFATARFKDMSLKFIKPKYKELSSYYEPAAVFGGLLAAQLVALVLLRLSDYMEFIRMTALEIPKYQGLMFDYPMPFVDDEYYLFWLPIWLSPIIGYMLVKLLVSSYKKSRSFAPDIAYAALIFIFGMLYIRFGVGRPDVAHINVSVGILFLSGFYILQLYVRYVLADKNFGKDAWVAALFVLMLFWPQATWSPVKLFSAANAKPSEVKNLVHLPNKPDESWLNDQQKAVVKYVKSNTSSKDYIYVMEPEPLYYYLTDRKNPSRFYISWFADPQPYTDELLKDLKKNPPKLVISSGPPGTEISDDIPIRDRIPEVDKWLKTNYTREIRINDTIILAK